MFIREHTRAAGPVLPGHRIMLSVGGYLTFGRGRREAINKPRLERKVLGSNSGTEGTILESTNYLYILESSKLTDTVVTAFGFTATLARECI
jgi:hypothetical protein